MLDTDTKPRIDTARDILVGKVPQTGCRRKLSRCLPGKCNTVEYDRIGAACDGEVMELIEFVEELRADALIWLKKNHPALCVEHV